MQVELWPSPGAGEESVESLFGGGKEAGGKEGLPGPGFPSPVKIREFMASSGSPGEYAAFVRGVFKDRAGLSPADGIWDLLDYLEQETDFYSAPASTRYHGAEPCGLVRHSLLVFANGIELAPLLLKGKVDSYCLSAACLFHDLCKTNMYESRLRNVKDEKTGEWKKEPFYAVRQDYISYGHGIESLLRLSRFIDLSEAWRHAVRWHMGAYDISQLDKIAMEKAMAAYREVLFLQTADMLAGAVEGV
ncbi:MAG: HD domain-containing protein [Treponema sp.]|jgi:hypothetical protein|nr:HD domain-containing protein [Treponema sp.]